MSRCSVVDDGRPMRLRLSALRPELARGHPLDRMKDPIERRQTLESAGAGDLGDRPPWCLTEQPAAQADALCGHGLGIALAGALEQHVHVADPKPQAGRLPSRARGSLATNGA